MRTGYEVVSCAGAWIADYERREDAEHWACGATRHPVCLFGVDLPPLDCVRVVRVRGRSRRTVAILRRDGAGSR
jgi:hypothetical protein